jgi:hypothetical protein
MSKVRCNTFVLSPLRFPNWSSSLRSSCLVCGCSYFSFSIVPQDPMHPIFYLIAVTILGTNFKLRSCLLYNVLLFIVKYICVPTGRDISDGIATCYGLDGSWIESRYGRYFSDPSRPALGPTHLPAQWVPSVFPGGKAAGTRR